MPTDVGDRLALPVTDLDETPDFTAGLTAVIEALDPLVAIDDQGVLADRPVSTPGTPGIRGRYYTVVGDPDASQNGTTWRDYGTGWLAVGGSHRNVIVGVVAANGTYTGSGFTVTHTAASGVYVISFTPILAAAPAVQATPASAVRCSYSGRSASGVTINTASMPGGGALDSEFTFTATAV